jgi:two-component system sensor histidine kinase KdpD
MAVLATDMQAHQASLSSYLKSVAAVVVAALVSWQMYDSIHLANLVMVFMLAIVFCATRYGRWPAIMASCLSVLTLDFFFVPPIFSFDVEDIQYLFTLAVMLVVTLVITGLAENLRTQAKLELRMEEESMRNALLSSISHDFRTPLATIVAASGSLLEDAIRLPEGVKREFLQTIHDEALRMKRLANNILDMARLEVGAMKPRREWYAVDELIGAALTRLRQRLAGRDVNVALGADPPWLQVDAVMFDALLENLLENAVKYTPPQTPIEIGAREVPGSIEFWVADRGPGLHCGTEQRLFDKFYREPSAQGESGALQAGAGLGLSICRAIVLAHDGSISAANRTGGGAIFRFALPLAGAPPQIATADREVEA